MKKLIFFLCFSVLILIGLFFGSINQQVAELNYFIAKAELRIVDIALLFLLLGFAIGLSLSLTILVKMRSKRWLHRAMSKT